MISPSSSTILATIRCVTQEDSIVAATIAQRTPLQMHCVLCEVLPSLFSKCQGFTTSYTVCVIG